MLYQVYLVGVGVIADGFDTFDEAWQWILNQDIDGEVTDLFVEPYGNYDLYNSPFTTVGS